MHLDSNGNESDGLYIPGDGRDPGGSSGMGKKGLRISDEAS